MRQFVTRLHDYSERLHENSARIAGGKRKSCKATVSRESVPDAWRDYLYWTSELIEG
jgi:hypothetical protein